MSAMVIHDVAVSTIVCTHQYVISSSVLSMKIRIYHHLSLINVIFWSSQSI